MIDINGIKAVFGFEVPDFNGFIIGTKDKKKNLPRKKEFRVARIDINAVYVSFVTSKAHNGLHFVNIYNRNLKIIRTGDELCGILGKTARSDDFFVDIRDFELFKVVFGVKNKNLPAFIADSNEFIVQTLQNEENH